jgi:translation initiation factor 2 alpha subunit (eIF-2alpha)
MIRFYNNIAPNKGETVVASITSTEGAYITCKLLEYEGIEGIICRAEVSRNTIKIYKSLKPGKIIPVICTEVDIKDNNIYIDLNYVTMDKEQISHYIERYEQIQKIINIFTWIAGTCNPSFNNIEYNDYSNNKFIRKIIYNMLSDSLYKMTKDEIVDLFYNNTYKLHEEAVNWKLCNKVPMFLEKLFDKFPKPNLIINCVITITNTNCSGINEIKKILLNIENNILQFDKEATNNITIISSPMYRIIIKSNNITTINYYNYIDIINNIINNYNNNFINITITNYSIETNSGTVIIHSNQSINNIIDSDNPILNNE